MNTSPKFEVILVSQQLTSQALLVLCPVTPPACVLFQYKYCLSRYRDSHDTENMAIRASYLYNQNSDTSKTACLYWDSPGSPGIFTAERPNDTEKALKGFHRHVWLMERFHGKLNLRGYFVWKTVDVCKYLSFLASTRSPDESKNPATPWNLILNR